MDVSLLLEYGWILLVLIVLEGILAADNALVLAIMVKHLPEKERKRALFYGLAGAFVFRFASLFAITLIFNLWQVQAIGAIYLLFIAINHLFRKYVAYRIEQKELQAKALQEANGSLEADVALEKPAKQKKKGSGFWLTVLKVEIADIAFAVDSILAAVALAMTLPDTPLPTIGGFDGGKFLVVFFGGLIGVIIMRFAATWFVTLLQRKPGLENAAFIIVGWVGIKLLVLTLAHHDIGIISEAFPHSSGWKISFYVVLVLVALGGWFLSKEEKQEELNTSEGQKVSM